MSNCLFGTPVYSDANQTYTPALSGGSWSGTLPLANLQDRRLSKVARSSAATLASTQFDVDLGTSRGIRIFAIPKHTLSLAAKIRIVGRSSTADNTLSRSEEFDHADWPLFNATVSANATTAPDGTLTADKIVETTANNYHGVYRSTFATTGNSQSVAVYSKAAERTWILLYFADNVGVKKSWVNLSTGAVGTKDAAHTINVIAAPNGFFRIEVVHTQSGMTTLSPQFFATTADTVEMFAGDITKGIYLWGAQHNAGTFPHAYLKTTTTGITGSSLAGGGALYDSGWVDVYGTIYPTGTLPLGHPSYSTRKITAEELAEQRAAGINYGYVLDLASHYEARYWRVEIDDTTNAAGYIDLGRLVLAAAWQPSINLEYGAKLGIETASARTETDGGAAVFIDRPRRRTMNFTIGHLPEDEAMVSPVDMMRSLGTTKQLYFVFDPADTAHLHRRSFLCVLKELSALDFPYRAYNAAAFALIEEL